MLDMSASPQMVQLAMLETIRVLRGEVDQVDMTNEYLKLHLDDDIESSMEETPLDSWVSNRL